MKMILCAGLAVMAGISVAQAADLTIRPRHHGHHPGDRYNFGYRSEVIGMLPGGNQVISGRVGLHRNDFGVMVPDSAGPNFIGPDYCTTCPLPF